MGPIEVLESLQSLGVNVEVHGDKLRLYQASRVTPGLKAMLVKFKPQIMELLPPRTSLYDLPFPVGYGGLPRNDVKIAEVVNDRLGITDPVLRKYNVMSHVRGYYLDLEGSSGEHYKAVKEEMERLRTSWMVMFPRQSRP